MLKIQLGRKNLALNNVPLPGQTLVQTRDQISGNFSVINTAFGINHVSYNDADQGKHKWITFPRQAGVPVPPFIGTEMALYTLLNATSGLSELYVQKGAGTGIPFTLSQTAGTRGWTYLPSGIIMVWGRDSFATPNAVFNFNTGLAGLPVFTNGTPVVQLTRIHNAFAGNNNQVMLTSTTTTQFTVQRSVSSGTTINFAWLAIGI